MSKLNIASNLMLGKAELNRFQKFIFDDGFIKSLLNNTVRFGIVYNTVDSSQTNYFNAFKVEQGTNQGTIKVNPGVAIDKNGNFIAINNLIDNIAIPDDGNYYWVKIAYKYTNVENGLVSVDAAGNLLGVGTEFTKIFRGEPNFPTRIKFPNSVLNVQEYDILSITSDTVALLNVSAINAESNLQYSVVGTFTPGQVPSAADKYPFQYDSCIKLDTLNGIVAESGFNVRPNYDQNIEFYIARIKNNSGVMEIQDKRDEVWETKADFEIRQLLATTNNCFGLEGVMYDTLMGTNSANIVNVGWGVRSTNWTLNHSNRIVSLLSCVGGKYKSTADFVNGSFNYWRIYSSSGKQAKVLNSVKNGTQIDLYIDMLDPDDFPGGQIVVVPDAEEIELIFKTIRLNAGTGDPIIPSSESVENNKIVSFPIADSYAQVPLAIWDYNNPDDEYMQSGYSLSFRYKTFKSYSQIFIDSNSYPYLSEAAYNNQGEVINNDATRSELSGGLFTIAHNPQAYHFFKSSVYLGDKYCVKHNTLSDASPVTDLRVGIACQYQIFEGSDIMSVNQYISLSTVAAVPGNKFYLNFQTSFTNPNFGLKFQIVQDYVNAGTTGKLLFDFTDFEFEKSQEKNLLFHCEFDGTNWIIFKVISAKKETIDTKGKIVFNSKFHMNTMHDFEGIHTVSHNAGVTDYMVVGHLIANPALSSSAKPRGGYWFLYSRDANSFVMRILNAFSQQDDTPFDFEYALISLV